MYLSMRHWTYVGNICNTGWYDGFLGLGWRSDSNLCLGDFHEVIGGTYSTIFVASPTILLMQDVQPWLSELFTPSGEGSDSTDEPA